MHVVVGDNVVPGSPDSQSSYRSELSGLYGIVFFITTMIEYFHPSDAYQFTGKVKVGNAMGSQLLTSASKKGSMLRATIPITTSL